MDLVQLDDVTQISPIVTRVLGLNPGQYTLQGSNIYVIGSGNRRILLDTGEGKPGFIPLLLQALQSNNNVNVSASEPTSSVEITDVIISHWYVYGNCELLSSCIYLHVRRWYILLTVLRSMIPHFDSSTSRNS
jgi:hypothetical protein